MPLDKSGEVDEGVKPAWSRSRKESMSASKVELRCDMPERVEEGVREVMSVEAGASGLRWVLEELVVSNTAVA